MLTIRLQRIGRKGYPVYRVVVMEAQRHPSTGRVVAYVGSYNPHTKDYKLNKDLIEKYLSNGAQPTSRVVKLLVQDKINLPKWVIKQTSDKQGKIRFADKLRKNRPAEDTSAPTTDEKTETTEEVSAEESTAEVSEDQKVDSVDEKSTE